MKAYLFNPENDLALAADTAHFTPPKAAREVHAAGALLPLWWAGNGDVVIAPDEMAQEAERIRRKYGLTAQTACKVDLSLPCSPQPWGWSKDARRQFMDAGIDRRLLPDDEWLARHRDLSHRRTSIELLRAIGEREELIPVEAHTPAEALEAIARWGGDAYIKLPWSGSGRGVFRTKGMSAERLMSYIEGFIRRQGSVMVEKTRDKVKDFAMLFEATDSGVNFRGLSYFVTDARGAYGGNMVASQNDIIKALGTDPRYLAPQVEAALGNIIGEDYRGWLGVDMMTERRDSTGKVEIVPCVEVNLRMTMGVAALLIRDKLADSTPPALLSLKSGHMELV